MGAIKTEDVRLSELYGRVHAIMRERSAAATDFGCSAYAPAHAQLAVTNTTAVYKGKCWLQPRSTWRSP